LSTLEQYASFRLRAREFDEAEAMIQEVFTIRKKVLGPTHPTTRWTVHSFNSLYILTTRDSENQAFLRDVLRDDPENHLALDFLAQYLRVDALKEILPDSEQVAQSWRYTTEEPGDSWMNRDYDAAGWQEGQAVFGDSEVLQPRTPWKSRSIWIRREFTLDEIPEGRLVLRLLQDDSTSAYLNGEFVFERQGWTGRRYRLSYCFEKARHALRPGRNVLAIRCQNTSREGLIDAGLYMEPLEQSLFGSGRE
jgi:hypothetical protein